MEFHLHADVRRLVPRIAQAIAQSGMTRTANDATVPLRMLLPLELAIEGTKLRSFSTVTTFGTAYDVTLEELRIEALHPANAGTDQAVRSGTWTRPRPPS